MKSHYKVSFIKRGTALFLAAVVLSGCAASKQEAGQYGSTALAEPESEKESNKALENAAVSDVESLTGVKYFKTSEYEYEVDPQTFSIIFNMGDQSITAAQPGNARKTESASQAEGETKWMFPKEEIAVSVADKKDYLSVTLTSQKQEDLSFEWPVVSGEIYYLPIGEGKMIKRSDAVWNEYLRGKEFSALEQLSMPFWATSAGEYAVVYVMEDPYRSSLAFAEEGDVSFRVVNEYPEIDEKKEKTFRIYLTENDPAAIAKIYKSYVVGQGNFVSLKEKAAQNADIEKLYGAAHIYLWGDRLISPEDINWQAFISAIDSNEMKRVRTLAGELESGSELQNVFTQLAGQDYADTYQKNSICQTLSEIMKREDFNKNELAAALPDVFKPVEEWTNAETVDLIKEMKASGVDHAWIGLNDWNQAYAKPELAKTAAAEGYLVGPYDSYHSIHEPGKESWITAAFEDTSLYDNGTVINKKGEREEGFQGVGRKLNPTLSLPSVKKRVDDITSKELFFNSWFIDCDATGEIYDDYSPAHMTTQQQDVKARLERMAYIRDEKNMVIGSEGGNDFAASTIAFAHGIELPSFSWMDADMKENKDSPYYIGKYYSPTGGVAEHFAKQIPVKEKYYHIFLDPAYDVPLYKLVYNDSVITSYHWDWSTFKVEGAVEDRMLREVLYNTPPLYHLDRAEWEKYKTPIIAHTKVWSDFSKEAVQKEMTDFKRLTDDGLVQMTEYGKNLQVIANFTDTGYSYNEQEIPAHSLMILEDGQTREYTPQGGQKQ